MYCDYKVYRWISFFECFQKNRQEEHWHFSIKPDIRNKNSSSPIGKVWQTFDIEPAENGGYRGIHWKRLYVQDLQSKRGYYFTEQTIESNISEMDMRYFRMAYVKYGRQADTKERWDGFLNKFFAKQEIHDNLII